MPIQDPEDVISTATEVIDAHIKKFGNLPPLKKAKENIDNEDADALIKQTKLGFFKDPKYADARNALVAVAAVLILSAVLAGIIALAILSSGTALVPVLPILGVGLKGAGVAAVAVAGHSASAAVATAALTKGSVSLFALTAPKITAGSVVAYVLIGLSALALAVVGFKQCCNQPSGMRFDD